MPERTRDEQVALLSRRITESGLTVSAFARNVMLREPRTVHRWLSGDSPIPARVRAWLASPEPAPWPLEVRAAGDASPDR